MVLIANNNAAVLLRIAFKDEAVAFVNNMLVNVQLLSDRANADLGCITEGKTAIKQNASNMLGVITSNGLSFAK